MTPPYSSSTITYLDLKISCMVLSQNATVGRTPLAANSSTVATRLPRSSPLRPIVRELDTAGGMGVLAETTAEVGLGRSSQVAR